MLIMIYLESRVSRYGSIKYWCDTPTGNIIFKQKSGQFGKLMQIAKQFDFPTVFLFVHFLCKCRALPQTRAVRHKPFPYNNLTFANIAEPKKGLIMNTWQV